MSKATIYTTDGEVEIEYKWMEEDYTTVGFYRSKSEYTKFSKFNAIMWVIHGEEEAKEIKVNKTSQTDPYHWR